MSEGFGKKGFTLMELAISLAIFSIVLVSSIFVLTSAHQLSTQSRERLLALTAVRSTLETIKNTTLPNLGGVQAVVNNPANGFLPAALQNGAFAITLNGADPLVTVTVTLSWIGPKNIPQQVNVTTMRSRF